MDHQVQTARLQLYSARTLLVLVPVALALTLALAVAVEL